MNDQAKTKEELVTELQELRMKHNALQTLYEKHITERNQMEEALHNNEEKYSKAFLTSPYAVIITQAEDGKFIEINDAFTSITGFTREDAIANSSIGLKLWVNIEDRKIVLSDLFEGKEVKEKEFQFRTKNGEIITGLFSAKIIHLNKKPFILSSINDITDRKKVGEKLKESEERFRGFFELTADMVCIASIDGYFQQLNKSWEKILGYSRQEMMQKSYLDFVHPEDRDKTLLIIQQKLEKGEAVISFENRYICKDGGFVWLEWTSQPIPDKGLTFAIARDITNYKREEDAVRHSEKILRSILDATPFPIALVDLQDDKINFWSQSALSLFGHTAPTANEWYQLAYPDPDYQCEVIERWKSALETAKSGNQTINTGDYSVTCRDGSERICELYATFLTDSLIVTFNDITDRKHAEDEIKRKNKELQKLNAEKDKFFSIIAHDLRSPFNSLLGFTEIMEKELPTMTQDQIQKIAGSLRRSATNLFGLLENLLEWSHMQRGLITFNPEPIIFLPKALADTALAMEAANKKEIKITYDIPEELEVYADVNMLGSILRNLVSNAVKYTLKGGKVTISAKQLHNAVECSVCDTGIGMNQEMQQNLFNIDFNTSRKGTEKEPSTGLGLIICREFVEKHGGTLSIESDEGKGSTFYFTLPSKAKE